MITHAVINSCERARADVHTDALIHTSAALKQRPPCLTTTSPGQTQKGGGGGGGEWKKGLKGTRRGGDARYEVNG